MSRDKHSAVETTLSLSGMSAVSYLGSLGRVLCAGMQRNIRSIQHIHNEEAFRCLLANESKRSERSSRSFHVLFVYFAGPGGGVMRMDGEVTSKMLPVLSGVLRETDYIGWYRDGHIVGGVLTALGDHLAEEVSCRIEQQFVGGLRRSFPVDEFSRLRVRFFRSQELERIESVDRVFAFS